MTAIAHLAGRDAALKPLGWTGRDAAWLALVCLHSGAFLRSQYAAHHRCPEWTARQIVHRLLSQKLAREQALARDRGGASQHVCHVTARPIYRALDIEHVRHRRHSRAALLFRRLLSLDYVIEHPHLPWLPTEQEKVAHFTALGIPLSDLPQRTFKGAVAPTRRYFAVKLPIAADQRSATFVYTVSGKGDLNSLAYWADIHRRLWDALRANGLTVHVVAVTRTTGHALTMAKKLAKWCGDPPPVPELSPQDRQLMADVQRAREARDWRILDKWGGINAAAAALDRIQHRDPGHPPAGPSISTCATHVATRLAPDSLTLS